jgi:cytochrome c biogenesis protein CcmG, thiol:disulfide interchange protein DsbE
MKKNWKFIVPLVLFAGVVVLFYASLNRDKLTLPSPLIGKPAPQFSLPDLNDPAAQVANSTFAGKPYVVNVWGTWCPGCLQEHGVLLEIARRNEVPMIGISWRDDNARAALYLQKRGNPFVAVGVDPESRVAIDWGVYGAPETFLVGADGKVQYKHIGPMSLDVWQEEFVPRLKTRGSE